MYIDSHHHFWKYDPSEYDWISEEMKIIKTDFLPEDLKKEINQVNIGGVISVQARQSLAETDWLLEQARENDFIKAVTGWLPLSGKNIESVLETYSADPHLKAVRHVLQGEPDGYMIRDDFNRGIRLLSKYRLIYEILIFERQLNEAIKFVRKHPKQIFVIDHIAKPRIRDGQIHPWEKNIKEIAKHQNVYCKLSGLVTETDYKNWSEEQLLPYMEISLEAFGPERLMFGSDWPVCLVACSYTRWANIVRQFISKLSLSEQAKILGLNASGVYGISQLQQRASNI